MRGGGHQPIPAPSPPGPPPTFSDGSGKRNAHFVSLREQYFLEAMKVMLAEHCSVRGARGADHIPEEADRIAKRMIQLRRDW